VKQMKLYEKTITLPGPLSQQFLDWIASEKKWWEDRMAEVFADGYRTTEPEEASEDARSEPRSR
jgi:hypothetical protein